MSGPCFASCEAFLADQRFHWADPSPLWPELHRKPPHIFASAYQSLTYQEPRSLPAGMTRGERAFFNGIFKNLRNLERTYELVKATESDVEQLVASYHAHPSTSSLSDFQIRSRALQILMATYEKEFGFGVEFVDQAVPDDELMAVLARGNTFIDRAGSRLVLDMADGVRPVRGHWDHKVLVHRFQWYLILRDLKLHPQDYGNPKDVLALYKRLGDPQFNRGLNWSKTKIYDPGNGKIHFLFFQLFDSPENNGSNPGFYTEYRQYWPGLVIQ
jgi:hypothetical protein